MVPCNFKSDAKQLAHLELSGQEAMAASKRVKYMNVDGGVLKAGTKVDLPIWLGIALA